MKNSGNNKHYLASTFSLKEGIVFTLVNTDAAENLNTKTNIRTKTKITNSLLNKQFV